MNLECTPVFEKNYDSEKKIVINRGGTRSSKTYSLAQLAVLFLFTGYVKPGLKLRKGVWTTARKWAVTLESTVIRDFEEIITNLDLWGKVEHNKTRKTYKVGERLCEFIGLDMEQKVRGAKRDVLYCNEANELLYQDFKQLIRRTQHRCYIDFNPDDEEVWINRKLEQERQHVKGDVEVIVSTYRDNTFLSKESIEEIEYDKLVDPDSWAVYGEGSYGKRKGLIFSNWQIVGEIPKDAELKGVGLDFGFTNDPTAAVAVYIQNGELWVDEWIYSRGLTNPDIANKLHELSIGRTQVIADSSEPKSIQEIRSLRVNIEGANKGKDSVNNSIDILKRYKINITARSSNVISEFRTYKWKHDKNDTPLNEPVDNRNHAIDALRYFALNKLKQNQGHLAYR